LACIYNANFNKLRHRLFDGSHLDFPSMNQAIQLRPHQEDAVWRGMSSSNTLLAQVVGAGKTYTMAATGMKIEQAGLIRKPMYVVSNHLLEQFARESAVSRSQQPLRNLLLPASADGVGQVPWPSKRLNRMMSGGNRKCCRPHRESVRPQNRRCPSENALHKRGSIRIRNRACRNSVNP
jgi:hypothetical protein